MSHDSIRGCARPSVGPSVGQSIRIAFVSAGSDEPANDLFCVYQLVRIGDGQIRKNKCKKYDPLKKIKEGMREKAAIENSWLMIA